MRREADPRRPGPPPALLLAGLPGPRLPGAPGRAGRAAGEAGPGEEAPPGPGAPAASGGREPERDALSLDRIVRAGIEIADRDGLEALSMRRVAAALGAGTMSLYRHVAGKDDLIDLMAEAVLEETAIQTPPPGRTAGGSG